MIHALIAFSVRRPFHVAVGILVLIVAGTWAWLTIPFEPFPDLTANSVSIIAEAPGMAPPDVEQLVTFHIERALLGLPRTQTVRSTTKFGLSMTQVVFDDRVDPYFARQVVSERLVNVMPNLPDGVRPVMGPIATAMGEVYQYVIVSSDDRWDAMELKTLQDYTVAPQLRTVPGVAEVNSWGGFTEQVHVTVDPRRLTDAHLTLADIEEALARNNRNFGGAYTEDRGERFIVRGQGRFVDLDDIRSVSVTTRGGVPVRLGDIALVERGALPRQGAVTADGVGEVVSGMVIMRKGENAQRVIAEVQQRVVELQASLPAGVRIVPFYDQARLIRQTTGTIKKNLFFGGTLVVFLLWAFLRSITASVIVAVVIPLSMLWAFFVMRVSGFSANLMSLGALDFGLLVDASVVMVENIVRRKDSQENGGEDHASWVERVTAAASEVGRPVVFAIAIIVAVYLPVFALEGTERKMFVPMAFTVVVAILGSLVLALTFIPAAARVHLRKSKEYATPRFDRFREWYAGLLERTMPRPVAVGGVALFLLLGALVSARFLGSEFMPRLDEGSVLVQGLRLPSTALPTGVEFSSDLERALRELPEVETVVSKLGRPDLATEAMGTYESDTYVILKNRDEWGPGGKEGLLQRMDSVLSRVAGIEYAYTQPIQMRLDEAESGITTDVGVKIFGPDRERLAELAARVERVVAGVAGASEVKVSAASDVKELHVEIDRDALARYGLSTDDVGHQVELALGAVVTTEIVDGPRRIGVALRLPRGNTIDPALFERLPIGVVGEALVPLNAVALVHAEVTPESFAHEGGQRLVVVGANVRGRDVGSFVAEASALLDQQVPLSEGYWYEWGGQYRNQQTAARRLSILGPIAIAAIFLLLFSAFGNLRHSLLIMLNVPFAIVGGVGALWLMNLTLSTSALIGFIAVFGIAVLNGVVMVSYINLLRERGDSLHDSVIRGAATRLRPVLMTAAAASLGFLPMALSRSPGAELQRPLATVVIGGLVTSTVLTLLVLPTLYRFVEQLRARAAQRARKLGRDSEVATLITG
jgi:cobalt-zinc-cadmium resistance protein CzcA